MPKKQLYKFVEHTADVEFVAYGDTIESAFTNSILAMFDTISDIKKLSKSKDGKHEVKLFEKSPELTDLLWLSMQDALSLMDSEGLQGFAVKDLKIRKTGPDYVLAAMLIGKDKKQQYSKLDVKGVSRFDLRVELGRKGYNTSVVLDV